MSELDNQPTTGPLHPSVTIAHRDGSWSVSWPNGGKTFGFETWAEAVHEAGVSMHIDHQSESDLLVAQRDEAVRDLHDTLRAHTASGCVIHQEAERWAEEFLDGIPDSDDDAPRDPDNDRPVVDIETLQQWCQDHGLFLLMSFEPEGGSWLIEAQDEYETVHAAARYATLGEAAGHVHQTLLDSKQVSDSEAMTVNDYAREQVVAPMDQLVGFLGEARDMVLDTPIHDVAKGLEHIRKAQGQLRLVAARCELLLDLEDNPEQ